MWVREDLDGRHWDRREQSILDAIARRSAVAWALDDFANTTQDTPREIFVLSWSIAAIGSGFQNVAGMSGLYGGARIHKTPGCGEHRRA
jgi:hypothetical protein